MDELSKSDIKYLISKWGKGVFHLGKQIHYLQGTRRCIVKGCYSCGKYPICDYHSNVYRFMNEKMRPETTFENEDWWRSERVSLWNIDYSGYKGAHVLEIGEDDTMGRSIRLQDLRVRVEEIRKGAAIEEEIEKCVATGVALFESVIEDMEASGEAEIESINLVIDWCKKLSNILNDMKQIRLREVLTAADVALVIAQMAKLAEYVDEGKRHAYLSDARKLIELYSGREKGAALYHEVDAQAEYVNHLTSAAEDAIMKDGGLEREREVDKLDKEGRKEVHDYIDLAGCKRMLGDVGYGCEYEDIVKVLESGADEKIKFIKHPDAELYTDRYLVGLGSINRLKSAILRSRRQGDK